MCCLTVLEWVYAHRSGRILLCTVTPIPADEEPAISLHLEGGRADSEGVVVVMYEGTNGTICGDGWSLANAHVVCRQLGFDAALRTSTGEEFGGTPSLMWMTYVTCNGNETEIQNCTHAGFSNTTQCSHAVGVAVVCKG